MSKNWWTLGPRLSEASWLSGGGGSAQTARVWRAYTRQLAASAFSSLEGRRRLSWLGYPAAGSPSYGPRKQIVLLHVSSIKKYFRTKAYTIEGPFESLKALTQCLGRGSCADLLQFQRRSWLHSLPGRGSCALQVLRSSHAPDSPGNLSHAW